MISRLPSLSSLSLRPLQVLTKRRLHHQAPPPLNILEELPKFDIHRHRSPFIITSNGYKPRPKPSEGDLIPMECQHFERVVERSKAIVKATVQPPYPDIAKTFDLDGYMVIKYPQIQTLIERTGFSRSALCTEMDTLFQSYNSHKIEEVFGKPELTSVTFKVPFDTSKSTEPETNPLSQFPQLEQLVQFWGKLLSGQAKRDGQTLSTLVVSVRQQAFTQKQSPNVRGWLIPHNDRDVFPCKYSAFGTIKSTGFPVLNNVYSFNGNLIDTAGPNDMLLLNNKRVLHDAIYPYDDPNRNGTRYFINVSAY